MLPEADLTAERVVLGCMLLDSSAIRRVGELAGEDFSNERHRIIYAAMAALAEDGKPIDAVTLGDELRSRGSLEAAGSYSYLAELTRDLPHGMNLAHYARVVRERADLSRMARLGAEIQKRACEVGARASEILPNVETQLQSIRTAAYGNKRAARAFSSIADVPGLEGVPNRPVAWLVDGFIPRGALVTVAGEPAALKSWLALDLARCMASGRDFCGRCVEEISVLVLDRENPASVANYRREFLNCGTPPNLHYWGLWLPEQPPGPQDRRVLEFAASGGVVILDSLVRFHTGDENSARDMAIVTGWLRNLLTAGARAVISLYHKSDKSDKAYRGSSETLAGCDVLWCISKRGDNHTADIRAAKNRFVEEAAFAVRLERGGFMATETVREAEGRTGLEIVLEVVRLNPGQPKSRVVELAMKRGLSRRQAEQALDSGRFQVRKGPHNAELYTLPDDPPENGES